jgi:hypothetical protein
MTMHIFARMTKVDEATRTVTGIIANEALDHSGEIFDYAKSKPHFESWSSDIAKATGGKSIGNVRAMHGNVSAGITKELNFDDLAKEISVKAEITDDNEWNKVLKGNYTGFSIGGSYGEKWKDEVIGKMRYEAKPNEYSLVDLPCNPDAQFSVIKIGGAQEMRKFETPTDNDDALWEWAYRMDAAGRYAVAKALKKVDAPAMHKGMCSVANLASLLEQLGWAADDAEWEASWEGDGSKVPADLRDTVKTLGAILVRMATEESAELAASLGAKKSTTGDLSKSATSPEEIEMSEALQKNLDATKADLTKTADDLVKMTVARDELQKAVDAAATDIATRDELLVKAATALDDRNAVIEKFQNAPAPVRAALMAIAKSADFGIEVPEVEQVKKADGTVDEAATAIKKALMSPVFTR